MRRALQRAVLTSLCLALVCASVFFALCFLRGVDKAYALTGEETSAAAFEIRTPEELFQLAADVNGGLYDGYYGVTFALKQDIDIRILCEGMDNTGWIPIGTTTYPFKGTFDGGGYAVKGLLLDRPTMERVGLFGVANSNAAIENLTVSGSVRGNNYTAGIVGYNQGRIENCSNEVSVTASDGSLQVGGIAGYNTGTILASRNTGAVNVGFSTFVGGVAGTNLGTIENCRNAAALCSTSSMLGGITGNNASDGNIRVCLNNGSITGKSTIGGIAGNNQGRIANVFNRGRIISDNGTAGGIAGSTESSGTVRAALNVARVSGYADTAGVCGYNLGVADAVFYNSTEYNGPIVNGLSAENSAGLSARVLCHADVLTAAAKLDALDTDVWMKRPSDEVYCYFPELKYFADNDASFSMQASKTERTALNAGDIRLGDTAFIYDGTDREVNVYCGTTLLELGQDYTALYADNRNAGTATLAVTFINYFYGSADKEFEITRSKLEVEWDTLEFTYNGTVQTPVLRVLGGLAGSEEVTFTYESLSAKDAGIYLISAVLADTAVNRNYMLPPIKAEFEIVKAAIAIEWSSEIFVYNGLPQFPTAAVVSGPIGADLVTLRYAHEENVRAGVYTITAHLDDSDVNRNYCFLGETYEYEIEKRPITVLWADTNLYYNGTAQYPRVEKAVGVVEEQNITFIYDDYFENINADESGAYRVTLALADTAVNANYSFPKETHTYIIHKAPLVIAWWNSTLEYTGQPQYPGFYIESGRIGEEEITFSVSDYARNICASSGNAYRIEVTLADTACNANYSLPATIKTYDIAKAEFNPQHAVEFRSRTFGYDGGEKSIFISGGIPEGISVAYENNGHSSVGEYLVTARFRVVSNNFKPLTIDAVSAVMYIAQMTFDDCGDGIGIVNKGDAKYAAAPSVAASPIESFRENGKKTLLVYSVTIGEGLYEYSIPLREKVMKHKGLVLRYKDAAGAVHTAEYALADGRLLFSAEEVTEFALLADINLLPVWIVLGGSGMAAVVGVLFLLAIRKRRRPAVCVSPFPSIETPELSGAFESAVCGTPCQTMDTSVQKDSDTGPFTLDGVECLSYGWFVKSLRFKTPEKQRRICGGDRYALSLSEAIPKNSVFWCGKRYRISSKAYANLLERAREATREKE